MFVLNEHQRESPTAQEPPPPPLPVVTIPNADTIRDPATTDPTLRQLTNQASLAARAGQCTAVVVIARRIDELDHGYRGHAFVADDHIAACLQ